MLKKLPKTIVPANNHLVIEFFSPQLLSGIPSENVFCKFSNTFTSFHINTCPSCMDGVHLSIAGNQASTSALCYRFSFFNYVIDQPSLIDMSTQAQCIFYKRHLHGAGIWRTGCPGYLRVSCRGITTGKDYYQRFSCKNMPWCKYNLGRSNGSPVEPFSPCFSASPTDEKTRKPFEIYNDVVSLKPVF